MPAKRATTPNPKRAAKEDTTAAFHRQTAEATSSAWVWTDHATGETHTNEKLRVPLCGRHATHHAHKAAAEAHTAAAEARERAKLDPACEEGARRATEAAERASLAAQAATTADDEGRHGEAESHTKIASLARRKAQSENAALRPQTDAGLFAARRDGDEAWVLLQDTKTRRDAVLVGFAGSSLWASLSETRDKKGIHSLEIGSLTFVASHVATGERSACSSWRDQRANEARRDLLLATTTSAARKAARTLQDSAREALNDADALERKAAWLLGEGAGVVERALVRAEAIAEAEERLRSLRQATRDDAKASGEPC